MYDRKDKRFFDFACSCGEENMAKWDKVYEDVKAELETDDKGFVNAVVYNMQGFKNGLANIDGIVSDMWSGIAIDYYYDYKEELECEKEYVECKCDKDPKYDCEYTVQKFWIECDRIEHGLARAYQLVKEFDATLAQIGRAYG